MSKAVLISIRPKWCGLIALGEKTVEARKTKPKLNTPFKCYTYCTAGTGKNTFNVPLAYDQILRHYAETGSMECLNCLIGNGKVIGEFICNRIDEFICIDSGVKFKRFTALHEARLSVKEIKNYLDGTSGYGWNISNLVVYAKPKELCEFSGLRKTKFGLEPVRLVRPPQDWCYVEELEGRKTQ